MSEKKKTFEEFVGTDIDKEVDDFVDTLFDDEKPIEIEPEQLQACEAFVDNGWVENKECPKCKGAGWVFGRELEEYTDDMEDQQYVCDDPCHISIREQMLKNYVEQSTLEDTKEEANKIVEHVDAEKALLDHMGEATGKEFNAGMVQNALESTQTMPTSGFDDPYEEQYQFFMVNLTENLKPLVSSFLFIDGQDSVTFNVETTFKKKCKALTKCQEDMQACFEDKNWEGKKIIIEAIKEQ